MTARARGALILLLLASTAAGLLVLSSGCSCVDEKAHRALVEASRGYFDAAAPLVSASAGTDPVLRRNREGLNRDFERAVTDAEERLEDRGEARKALRDAAGDAARDLQKAWKDSRKREDKGDK